MRRLMVPALVPLIVGLLTLEGLVPADLHVIDLPAGTVEAVFPISARALAITPNGSHAYAIREIYPLPNFAVTQLAVFELAGSASKILAKLRKEIESHEDELNAFAGR